MKRIEERIGEMVKELPLEFQYEVEDFAVSVRETNWKAQRQVKV